MLMRLISKFQPQRFPDDGGVNLSLWPYSFQWPRGVRGGSRTDFRTAKWKEVPIHHGTFTRNTARVMKCHISGLVFRGIDGIPISQSYSGTRYHGRGKPPKLGFDII